MFPRTRRFATLRRSIRLLSSFRFEQSAPEKFYRPLAEDTALLIDALVSDSLNSDALSSGPEGITGLEGAHVLDVGGGPGYFADAFASRGARYQPLEPDVGEMAAAGIAIPHSVRGDGRFLPFRDASFDIAYSSNVAEHIPSWEKMGDEMLRVTKPGGLVILSYTIWLGPFGGHETGMWQHYVGGEFARDRYTRFNGHPPKNEFGTSLFDVSCADGLAWAQSVEDRGLGKVQLTFPRYHPSWAWWLVRVPVLREFLVSNLVVVIVKNPA